MKCLVHALAIAILLMPAGAGAAGDGFVPLTQWRAAGGGDVPSTWRISGADIAHTSGGGNIESVETFADFELDFDWRISPGGNSGIMYRVGEGSGAAYERGPEYQILDNAGHPDGRNPLISAASAYGLYAPASDVTRPAGEWNSGRILVDGSHVEHWLNGIKVLEYELGSADWKRRVAASKFAAWPNYGTASEGHITLQDHASAVDYRNIRIRALPE